MQSLVHSLHRSANWCSVFLLVSGNPGTHESASVTRTGSPAARDGNFVRKKTCSKNYKITKNGVEMHMVHMVRVSGITFPVYSAVRGVSWVSPIRCRGPKMNLAYFSFVEHFWRNVIARNDKKLFFFVFFCFLSTILRTLNTAWSWFKVNRAYILEGWSCMTFIDSQW